MPYDHSVKIGNQGDLVKHAVLASVVDLLAKDFIHEKFVYAESHTGRPEYILIEKGAWSKGIGSFSSHPKIQEDRQSANPRYADLRAYDETCVGRVLRIGMRYPGSSGLVFNMLMARGLQFTFHLFEIDSGARIDLMRYYYPWQEIKINPIDGYEAVANVGDATLVLIDPPDLNNPEKILQLCQTFEAKGSQFVCWIPRIGNSGRPVDGGRESPSEARQYVEFRDACPYPIFPVRWVDNWRTETCGCYIVASNHIKEATETTIKQICEIMEWYRD